MKNSDYGAMWMLASTTQDPLLTQQRVPYALNFKLAQQQTEDGFFKGLQLVSTTLQSLRNLLKNGVKLLSPLV
jgi:hypothetical protein